MEKIRHAISELFNKFIVKDAKGARDTMLEELFNDLYKNRKRIYKLNFFRGVFFGLGSVIGGTVVLALLIWLLSLFVNFPVVGNFFEQTKDSLRDTSQPQ